MISIGLCMLGEPLICCCFVAALEQMRHALPINVHAPDCCLQASDPDHTASLMSLCCICTCCCPHGQQGETTSQQPDVLAWPGTNGTPGPHLCPAHGVHVCMSRAAAQWQCICSYLASGYGASRELYSWPQAPARQPQRPPSQAPVELAPCPGALLTPTAAAARSRQQQGTQSWQGPRRGS